MSYALIYLRFETVFSVVIKVNNAFPFRANKREINISLIAGDQIFSLDVFAGNITLAKPQRNRLGKLVGKCNQG